MQEYEVRFTVSATKAVRKQGYKLGLSEKGRLEIIADLRDLKYWPDNEEFFDYEKAFGALEFKYTIEKKWIRVIVFQDNNRRVMWVIRVFAKKSNKISKVDEIAIRTAVKQLEAEIRLEKKGDKS